MSRLRAIRPGRRVTSLLVTLAVLAAAGAVVGGVLIVDAIQASRLSATIARCKHDNLEHRALLDFVNFAAPQLNSRASRDFPVVADCAAYAHRLLR